MIYEFGIQMNQFNDALKLETDDILYWLNKAQEKLVKDRFNGRRNGVGFEQSYELIADLQNLVERGEQLYNLKFIDEPLEGFFTEKAELPLNYLYLIAQRVHSWLLYPEIEYTLDEETDIRTPDGNVGSRVNSARYSQTDDIYRLLEDPFNTTKSSSPLTTISGNGIFVYSNKTFIPRHVIIDYIRIPKTLALIANEEEYTVDESELPDHLQKEIIQLGVDLFLQNTRDLKQRLQLETPTADNTQNTE